MTDTRYTYAVARIRALETNLLDRPTIERLMNEDASGVIRILKETEYSTAFNDIESPLDFEYGLNIELDRILSLLEKLSPEPEIIQKFRGVHDFHNLKVLLQAKFLNEAPDESISPLGLVHIDNIQKMIDGETVDLPEYLKQTYQKAIAAYEKKEQIEEIEDIIICASWNFLMSEIEKIQNDFLISLLKKQIDLINIRTFIRLKDIDAELVPNKLLPQGNLEPKFFIENLTEEWDVFFKQLNAKGYGDVVARGLNDWPQDKSLWKYELAADNHILKIIERVKLIYFGIEPLIAYFILKKIPESIFSLVNSGPKF